MDQASGLRSIVRMQTTPRAENAKVLTITSGKGGVGKSNMAVNLAVQFRKMGKRVIIFDADFGLANVGVMFNTIADYTLKDVIFGGKDITEIITPGPMDIGFISGGSGISELNNLRTDQVDYVVRSLSKLNDLTDILMIDTGAGVSDAVLKFVLASPEVLLVATPEPSSLTDTYSLVKALYTSPDFIKDGTNIHLVVNKVHSRDEADAVYDKLNAVVTKFLDGALELDYIGMVPEDPALEKAVRAQQVVSELAPNARSAKAFESIARELLDGEDDTNTRYKWGIAQLFHHFTAR